MAPGKGNCRSDENGTRYFESRCLGEEVQFEQQLEALFPGRVEQPSANANLPSGIYFVYILAIDGKPVIVGHGKRNRAMVIFDSVETTTGSHIKALTVRLYALFGGETAVFSRYLIQCTGKEEARMIESQLQRNLGGNALALPMEIEGKLLDGIEERSAAWMALKMALCSSFDGISDLRKWRREGILGDETWEIISTRLRLGE